MMNDHEAMAHIGDTVSISVLFGYYVAGLPTIALTLTVVWTLIRIYAAISEWWKSRK